MSCDRSSCCGSKLLSGKNVIKWTKSKSCQRMNTRGVFHTFVAPFGVWIHQLHICQLPSSLPTSLGKLWFSCDSAATVWFCCHNLAAFVERWTLFCSHGWGCVSCSLPRNSIFLFLLSPKHLSLLERFLKCLFFFIWSDTLHKNTGKMANIKGRQPSLHTGLGTLNDVNTFRSEIWGLSPFCVSVLSFECVMVTCGYLIS